MIKQMLNRFVAFRQEIHQHPETAFEEFETRKRIISILKELGVAETQMTQTEPTALYVDLRGKANPTGQRRCIAFRADMDALHMV
jgi:hippurate hydrolase